MPMLVATLKLIHWNKKPKMVSMKPMNLSCALRVSDKQTKESAFRDAVLQDFQDIALGYLTGVSHLMAFPEIVIASVVELKKLKLRGIKHQTIVKQLLDKISENNRFIEKKRQQSGLALREVEKIAALELQLRGETPLYLYSDKYHKVREQRIRAANEDLVEDYDSEEDQKKKQNDRIKNKKRVGQEAKGEETMDTENHEYSNDEIVGNNKTSRNGILEKLDSVLGTEEEGDDDIGFEVTEDEDDDENE
ncbi:nucleolar complex protein 2-like [Tropilaelaps mercedesae]|uniref:Nucleolar complex protein 2-like n=1 Tax=Tropilaelaps mercedesae TaxID=418985 RepID=A0A1V9Y1A5_9ACAR|nr:nucleolar complex protein 2-like [Tropilaelaps mercedesae]